MAVEGKRGFRWISSIINQRHGFIRDHCTPQAFFTCFTHLITFCGWAIESRSILYMEDFKCLLYALKFLLLSPGKTRFSKSIGHLFRTKPWLSKFYFIFFLLSSFDRSFLLDFPINNSIEYNFNSTCGKLLDVELQNKKVQQFCVLLNIIGLIYIKIGFICPAISNVCLYA